VPCIQASHGIPSNNLCVSAMLCCVPTMHTTPSRICNLRVLQAHGMTPNLAKLLEPSNSVFVHSLGGEEDDFEQHARQWRRTEGPSLTVTSSNMSERSW
jgi:hypothetical protein